MTEEILSVEEETIDSEFATDGLQQYYKEINQYPLLSIEEEMELAKACARGDGEAIKTMVRCNLRLVVSFVMKHPNWDVPMLDMIQGGNEGLIRAAEKFDYTRGTRFSTNATWWIRYCIDRSVAEFRGSIPNTISLDMPVGEDGEDSMGSLMEDLQTPLPQSEVVRQELKNTLDMLLSVLNARQRQVLKLRYGLDGSVPCSFQTIAKEMGISKERARQIDHEALEKLKKAGADFGLEDFLGD